MSKIFEFGECILNCERFELTRAGRRVKIEPKAMELLILLVSGHGRLITRDEIAASLWHPGVFVDVNTAINTLVRKIRSALRDNIEKPRYIETVSGKGYRLVSELIVKSPSDGASLTSLSPEVSAAEIDHYLATADPLTEGESANERKDAIPVDPPPHAIDSRAVQDGIGPLTRRNLLWTLSGAAAAFGGAAWFVQANKRTTADRVMRVVVDLPEGASAADPGRLLGGPAVAPDGTCLVLALGTVAGVYLFKRYLDADSFIRLEGTQGASFPFWSPDSRTVGFFAGGQLKTVPVNGGSAVSLCKAAVARGGAWGRNRQILFSAGSHDSIQQELFAIAETGGPVQRVTALDRGRGENSHRYPSFLADGSEFLYFIRSDDEDVRGIYLDSLDSQKPRFRLAVADGPFAVGVNRGQNLIYVISQQAGKVVAQRFDQEKKQLSVQAQVLIASDALISVSDTGVLAARITRPEPTTLRWRTERGEDAGTLGERGDYWSVNISPDDTRIAVVKRNPQNGEFSAFVAPASSGVFERVSEGRHISSIRWSPDSSALYYSDNRNGTLRRRNIAAGGREEEVSESDVSAQIEDVSPEERYVVFELLRDSSSAEIGWAELKPETHAQLIWHRIAASGDWWIHPSFSPDGRWLAYASREEGRSEIYISNFPECTIRKRISASGGHSPRWRRDGNAIFFISLDGALMEVSRAQSESWKEGLAPKRLFSIRSPLTGAGPIYDYGINRKRFLLIEEEAGPEANRIEIVLNWHTLLQQAGSKA